MPRLTSHPGITVTRKKSKKHVLWVARWVNPDTGRVEQTSLSRLGLDTTQARLEWAKQKSKSVNARKAAIEAGAPITPDKSLKEAVAEYLKTMRGSLRPRTLDTYNEDITTLLAWADKHQIDQTHKVTGPILVQFRNFLSNKKKRAAKSGGKQGEKEDTIQRRSPGGINKQLRSIKVVMNYLRRIGLTPRLTKDIISDSLKPLRSPKPELEYLEREDIAKLLEACRAHDSAVFKVTRNGKAKKRYAPIGDFILFVLLSGCRFSEAHKLTWADVYLDALNGKDRPPGKIKLKASATKTHQARTIDLSISPLLRATLQRLESQAVGELVFPITAGRLRTAQKRLIQKYKAPSFTFQALRQTTGTYLSNAPGIWGGASAYRSARQLGHSVVVAERHYVGVLYVDPDAQTIESAMGIGALLFGGF